MKTLTIFVLLGLTLSVLAEEDKSSGPMLAADAAFCEDDSSSCRGLAIEVAKLDILDAIKRDTSRQTAQIFLCPEDNPNCCPPHLMPVCQRIQLDVARRARDDLHTLALAKSDDCPWDKKTCDSLGSFYCGPDKDWSPLLGCNERPKLVIPDFPPVPDPCPCGYRENHKRICIPKLCTFGGHFVDCQHACGVEPPRLELPRNSRLAEQLQNREVQIEAANAVRDDLMKALSILDEQVKQLSGQ